MGFCQIREGALVINNAEQRTALIIIDMQQALFEKTTPVFCAEALVCNINSLIACAHEKAIPVFFFRHVNKSFLAYGSAGWQLHPALNPTSTDIVLEKTHGSAFQETCLHQTLQERQIKRLVVAGLVTNGCIRATCEDAQKHGYEVILVKDGHSTYQRGATKIIDEWNDRLGEQGIEVVVTQAVQF